MMGENEERKEAIKELKYLFYTMPIKPPIECDDKDKWKDNNKKLRTALEYAITSLQEKVPIEDSVSRQEVIDTIFNHFHVKSASVVADDKTAKIIADGTYKKEKFNCKTEVKNDFKDKIRVNYMDLFLDKFIVKKSEKSSTSSEKFDFNSPNKALSAGVRDINMDIDKYNITVNSIIVKTLQMVNCQRTELTILI